MSSPIGTRIVAARALVALLSLTWCAAASATPDFPAVVVKTLELPGITIDPPQGCELCHTSDSGGTSLRPFGALLLQYGTQPYEESTLEQALGQLTQDEPQLVADIKASRDPNDDTGSADVHTPEYGCTVRPAPGPRGLVWATPLGALAALSLRKKLGGRPHRRPRSATAPR